MVHAASWDKHYLYHKMWAENAIFPQSSSCSLHMIDMIFSQGAYANCHHVMMINNTLNCACELVGPLAG